VSAHFLDIKQIGDAIRHHVRKPLVLVNVCLHLNDERRILTSQSSQCTFGTSASMDDPSFAFVAPVASRHCDDL
jgi:hypothetical protein